MKTTINIGIGSTGTDDCSFPSVPLSNLHFDRVLSRAPRTEVLAELTTSSITTRKIIEIMLATSIGCTGGNGSIADGHTLDRRAADSAAVGGRRRGGGSRARSARSVCS